MNNRFKMTTMRFASALALLGLGRATATQRFHLPETLEELGQYIEILSNPLYKQDPVCSNASEPFLLRYDTNETSGDVYPVCLSVRELFARRADMSICNTKVTLGPKVEGGCSQHNFFEKNQDKLVSLSTFDGLEGRDDIIAVPIHRNVPYYHNNRDNSPNFPTKAYYAEAKYLPCEMTGEMEHNRKANDLGEEIAGYCDIETVVKKNLCWTGVGSEPDQGNRLNGVGFHSPEPCDVMQHLDQHLGQHRDLSVHNPGKNAQKDLKDKAYSQKNDAETEAARQVCTFDSVVKLWELADADWYTGDDGIVGGIRDDTVYANAPTNWVRDYWYGYGAKDDEITAFRDQLATKNVYVLDLRKDRCKFDSDNCFDMQGNACNADSAECSVYNVKKYSSKTIDKCFRKDIERTWSDGVWSNVKIQKREYRKKDWQHSEKYYSYTPARGLPGGPNACDGSTDLEACKNSCYDRCKDMKFPGFSVTPEGDCRCSDYGTPDTCSGGWVSENTNRKSYTISPRCGDSGDCIGKTRYSDELRPCDFTADYRKHKCMETCADELALFMTITESGVCLCSKKKRGSSNADVGFKTDDVCPWSNAARVHTDRVGRLANKGYEGDSFVTVEPLETYQLKYNSYYEDERTPQDGIIICENGSPVEELKRWYQRLTGDVLEETVTLNELKSLHENLSN